MTEETRAVGGIRLAARGLHVGHYAGTFSAAEAHHETRTLYYIIKDTEPFIWADSMKKREWIETLARETAAVSPLGLDVRCVLSSVIMNKASGLINSIYDNITYSFLVTAHFAKMAIREGSYKASIRNFMFPLDEAIIFTFLRADRFYSNRDNERILRFTRDVQRILQKRGIAESWLPITELMSHPALPYLSGNDHRRMNTAGKNILPISSDDETIVRYCRDSLSLSMYFEVYPNELSRFKSEASATFIPSNTFAPFSIIMMLAGNDRLEAFKSSYRSKKNSRHLLADELASIVIPYFEEWRGRARRVIDGNCSYDRVESESHEFASAAAKYWNNRLQNILSQREGLVVPLSDR